jgi:magnesium chelatase family protein
MDELQPLEDGAVPLSRAAVSVTFPLALHAGRLPEILPVRIFWRPTRECHCTPPMIQRYVSKISGPLLDRD